MKNFLEVVLAVWPWLTGAGAIAAVTLLDETTGPPSRWHGALVLVLVFATIVGFGWMMS